MYKPSILAAIILVRATATMVRAGWFGPDNYNECMRYYLDKAENISEHNGVSWGCKNKFVTSHPKYGQCLLDHIDEIRGRDGFSYVDAACAQLFREEMIRGDYPGILNAISRKSAICMLKHVEKIIDDDSFLFFTNIKCDAR